jgi:hypothetical protein
MSAEAGAAELRLPKRIQKLVTRAQQPSDILNSPDLFSPRAQRQFEVGMELRENPPAIHEADYLHAALCQVGFPRRKLEAREFERTDRGASIFLQAGKLWDGHHWVPQPLPHGPKPRLIMIYVTTEAKREKTRTISLKGSLRQFLLAIGLAPQGHHFNQLKAQINALAACKITLGLSYAGQPETRAAEPFQRFQAWFSPDDKQGALWPAELELRPEFYDSLIESAVPLAPAAIAQLAGSALALDVYAWLAHRLRRVGAKGAFVSWENLHHQFGQEYGARKDFKREFRKALWQAQSVYLDARLEVRPGGLWLRQSPPPIREKTVVQVPHNPAVPTTGKILPGESTGFTGGRSDADSAIARGGDLAQPGGAI